MNKRASSQICIDGFDRFLTRSKNVRRTNVISGQSSFLTGLTGLTGFSRKSCKHEKTLKGQSENGFKPVKPVKTRQTGAVA